MRNANAFIWPSSLRACWCWSCYMARMVVKNGKLVRRAAARMPKDGATQRSDRSAHMRTDTTAFGRRSRPRPTGGAALRRLE
jgi:hypothetical protein